MSVCAVVGCDRAAVARGLCNRFYARFRKCLPPRPPENKSPKENKALLLAEVVRRRKAGESTADIAAVVDVNATTVRAWLRGWGVEKGAPLARPENSWKAWAEDDIQFAVTRTDLAEAERAAVLGRTVDSIIECVRKHGSLVSAE